VIGLLQMTRCLSCCWRRQAEHQRPEGRARQTGQKLNRSLHRRTDLKPSEVILNSGEGLRAAYYVEDDPASYSSLKQHIHQIDLLFPECSM